jgi:hypothetical protein
MTQQAQIRCIKKTDRADPHERISHIGGFTDTMWSVSLDEAIRMIESGDWRFYVSVGGRGVWVVVATSPSGRKYLKTEGDGLLPNNLLSLPECP